MKMVNPLRLLCSIISTSILVFISFSTNAQAVILTSQNSTTGSPPNWNVPSTINNKGILVRPIRSMYLLNSSPGAHPNNGRSPTLDRVSVRANKSTVINGTFSYWPQYQGRAMPFSKGMIIRNDLVEANETCDSKSGAVVIKGGQIIVARSGAINLKQVFARFGRGISGFMGCGVLLIENGRTREPLSQGFGFDINNGACRANRHALIGIRRGVAYAIFNPGTNVRNWLSCKHYRNILHSNGFSALIKFDGSSGFFYKDSATSEGPGRRNPTGFLIQEW